VVALPAVKALLTPMLALGAPGAVIDVLVLPAVKTPPECVCDAALPAVKELLTVRVRSAAPELPIIV